MQKRLKELLDKLPPSAGVYIMRGRGGEALYIGKARNLRARVRSYFRRSGDDRWFVRRLPGLLEDIEVILTPGEKDALVLERRLVQREHPRFNADLQDDKSFLSICLGEGEFPRLLLARRRPHSKEGQHLRWFGPFTSAQSARETFRLAQQSFGLRTCPDRVMRNRARPCLLHGMGRCLAPCVGRVGHEEYAEAVRRAAAFLRGDRREVLQTLEGRMREASAAWEFELAARLRDKMKAVEQALAQQPVIDSARSDLDAVGFYREGEQGALAVLKVRSGCLLGVERIGLRGLVGPVEDCLRQALVRHYAGDAEVPPKVLVSAGTEKAAREDLKALSEWLGELRGGKVAVGGRGRGATAALLGMAEQNAADYFRQRLAAQARCEERLDRLQRKLILRVLPRRIECVDLSTTRGGQSVGAVAVLKDGEPAPSEYRRFRIRQAEPDEDLAMMAEVVERRLRRLVEEKKPLPDLLLLDGGAAHLKAVERVVERLGLEIELAAVAKGRARRRKGEGGDEFYRPGRKNPIPLRPQDEELLLLSWVRDEAHRFALSYHRRLRARERLGSHLAEIPGVGPIIARRLLDRFGGLEGIRRASRAELLSVPGVSEPLAERIDRYLAKTVLTCEPAPASSQGAAQRHAAGEGEAE